MAILRRQFHKHERNMGNEDWHYLARDTETGRIFVIHAWSHRERGGHFDSNEVEMTLEDFLTGREQTARQNLLTLIGSLVGAE